MMKSGIQDTDAIEQNRSGSAGKPYPSKLFVEVTTHCNLRCDMCVKQSAGNGIAEGMMSEETFLRLAPA
ncbi:MAG TPA: hypothetical protein VK445_06250, partial [Dissulfurispiraceae bacterium]|nr:hypothetical protein [Dissulfurispiraceae bacterium]